MKAILPLAITAVLGVAWAAGVAPPAAFAGSNAGLVLASLQEGDQQDTDQGAVGVGVSRNPGDPLVLIQSEHEFEDLLAGGIVKNTGSLPIFAYRIGWAVSLRSASKPHVYLGDWVTVSAGILPKGKARIPSQRVPFSLIRGNDATQVEFFVAAVRFRDGSEWKAPQVKELDQER